MRFSKLGTVHAGPPYRCYELRSSARKIAATAAKTRKALEQSLKKAQLCEVSELANCLHLTYREKLGELQYKVLYY